MVPEHLNSQALLLLNINYVSLHEEGDGLTGLGASIPN